MSHKQPRSSAWTQGQDKHAEWVTTQIVSPCPVTSLQEERVGFKRTAQLELPANHQEAARSPTVELQGKLDLQPFSHRFYRITGPGSQQRTRPTPPRLYIAQVWKVGGMCPRSFAWFEAGLETKWAKKVQLFKFSQSLLQAQLCVHLWTFPRMSGSTAKSLSQWKECGVQLRGKVTRRTVMIKTGSGPEVHKEATLKGVPLIVLCVTRPRIDETGTTLQTSQRPQRLKQQNVNALII